MSIIQKIQENIRKVIVGKEEAVDLTMVALISNGHILFEDVPGTGKTLLAKSVAKSIDASFKRLQFTSDTLPADILGQEYFDLKDGVFRKRYGPIFANIVLVDEINRTVPRTQSALLEVMEERTVTIGDETTRLPAPFLVIATQNPLESDGTFPLPDAQLDRFLMTIRQGYPTAEEEREIMRRFREQNPIDTLQSVITAAEIIQVQEQAKKVSIDRSIEDYIISNIQATRSHSLVEIGVSPRGSLALMKACQSRALLYERTYCTPDDVQALATPVLAHRLVLTVEGDMKVTKQEVIQELIHTLPVPVEHSI
ncbi:AAA family ATPase [Microbacteriaceae bacterium 4G12]